MKIEEVKISDISNHEKNPKIHPEKQIRLIEESIKKFGWTNPVILSADGVCLAGHARIKSAIELGMDTVPCIRTKLSGKEADAYLLADNRLSDIAPYDKDILAELLGELPDDLQNLTGFDSGQIDSLINGTDVAEAEKYISSTTEEPLEEVDAEPQTDRAAELNEKWQVKTGDLWQLGDHRLICGDCTDPAVVELVMMGEKADLVLTDPPYGVNYVGGTKDALTISNDGANIKQLSTLINLSFKNAPLNETNTILAFMGDTNIPLLCNILREIGVTISSLFLVWIKDSIVMGRGDYNAQHELCVRGWKGKHEWNGGNPSTIYQYARPKRSESHPTMKPVDLIGKMIEDNSGAGYAVYDPFLGSGTTMIACENTGRKCRGIEISPDYCAVILQRFKDATGKEPVRIDG